MKKIKIYDIAIGYENSPAIWERKSVVAKSFEDAYKKACVMVKKEQKAFNKEATRETEEEVILAVNSVSFNSIVEA